MKKLYYCGENIENPSDFCQKDDFENERRKQLSIETNRRRREMAMKVKREIEKEEKRRKEILKQRKEYQNNLNEKLHRRSAQRCSRTISVQQLTSTDLDRTLTALRGNVTPSSLKQRSQSSEDVAKYSNRLESAWSDAREVCASPMTKYCGPDSGSRQRDNDHYLRTFETKLMEQEEVFRQKQTVEMSKFMNVLHAAVVDDDRKFKKLETTSDDRATYRVDREVNNNKVIEEVLENIEDECDVEDSLEISAKSRNENVETINYISISDSRKDVVIEGSNKDIKSSKVNDGGTLVHRDDIRPSLVSSPPPFNQQHVNQHQIDQPHNNPNQINKNQINPSHINQHQIKYETLSDDPSKTVLSHKPSLPSFSSANIKSILKKGLSNNFGSNPDIAGSERSGDIRDSVELTKTRSSKLFRSSSFSHGINDLHDKGNTEEDTAKKFVRFAEEISNGVQEAVSQTTKVPIPTDLGRPSLVQKVQKTSTVPGSTPLKPPLHPRSTQEGSYLQGTLKRNPTFQPPPRPRKISVETLDKQLEPILHPKKSPPITNTMVRDVAMEKHDDSLCNISLDKTPTENEIEQLWAEVRECLSKSRTTSKPESVGLVSGRTIDSGSDVSVRSAPTWQRSAQRQGAPFQVRHHRPWSSRHVFYPGQESPIRDEVTVHGHCEPASTVVTQQPLNVIGQRDQDFQAVSESMEEFLSIEGSCGTPNARHLNSTFPASTAAVFLPRPPSNSRARPQPIRWNVNPDSPAQSDKRRYGPYITETTNNKVPSTQLSLDEDKVKKSLDRLNVRLKNMTTFV